MTTKIKLQRIAQLSKRDPNRSFINLMCTFNEESLKEYILLPIKARKENSE